MDFAIAPLASMTSGASGRDESEAWQVLCLRRERGIEVAQCLASFGHRGHAEAFLADLLASGGRGEPGLRSEQAL